MHRKRSARKHPKLLIVLFWGEWRVPDDCPKVL